MMFIFTTPLALTLLSHPFQVALMVLTLGALVRSIKPMATSLAYSFFALVDFFLDELPGSVVVGSTAAIVVLAILTLARYGS